MPVRISPDLHLPDNVVTQTLAFIARKSAGKTYAAGKLCEGLHAINAPFIVVDPVGNWYGLRLNASGKGPGLPIPVFGGEHGDLEITAEQGEAVGRLLVEQNLSAVLDVSTFRKNERKRFVTDFAETLFHYAKSHRSPRMVVFEEAQVFAPQRTQAGEERMLGAVEDIVRLGRNYGLGTTLISQRPQSINKEVLNQVECLFVGQINAAHERKAIEDWVMDHKADKSWTKTLPTLETGLMVVWSPQWLKEMKEIRIGKKTTYDASATPELGQEPLNTKKLASIDLPSIQAALEALTPKKAPPAAATKPDAGYTIELVQLRAEVGQLNVELDAARRSAGVVRWEIASQLHDVIQELKGMSQRTTSAIARLEGFLELTRPDAGEGPPTPAAQSPKAAAAPPKSQEPAPARARPTNGAAATGPGLAGEGLAKGARRMLEALGKLHPALLTRAQMATAAEIKTSGGSFNQSWSKLRMGDYLEEPNAGLYRASKKTLKLLGISEHAEPKTHEERLAFWNERLTGPERRALHFVVRSEKDGVSREQLGLLMGVVPSGGSFNAALGTLIRNNLVLRQRGRLFSHPWLLG